jgi:formylglycine-generating enzyme
MRTQTAVAVCVLAGAAALGALTARWQSSGSDPAAIDAGGAALAGAQSCGVFHEHEGVRAADMAPGPAPAGMVWVPGGTFRMGSDSAFPEEGPASTQTVEGFWIDRTEVTNAQFAEFVAATGYLTLAERGVRRSNAPDAPIVRGSAVFRSRAGGPAMTSVPYWWEFVEGTSWRAPDGPGSSLEGLENYPVVHVAYEDARAYAQWKGRRLPTEAQFELAAQGTAHRDAAGAHAANTWQGMFPSLDLGADGHLGIAPVACYPPNPIGAYDLIGNVWEWTASPYYERHDFADRERYPDGFDPTQPDEPAVAVIKGGSFLCSPDYCLRYRPEARIGQSRGLGAAHIGIRTILQP